MVHIKTQHYNGSVIWFTETDFEAEWKYPDRRPCNA